jgi:5-methylcytosine-specific restriction endonuclease McrA
MQISSKKVREKGTVKKWRQSKEGKERCKVYNLNRRHKNHDITEIEWLLCKEYFNNSCAYCGMILEEHKEIFNQDLHKEHKDDNGSNDLSNCIPGCKNCNSQKWKFEFDEWYNENNSVYTKERYDKIIQWLNSDYILYLKNR